MTVTLLDFYRYYSENKEELAGYHDRGVTIPPTRKPGVIHHARLGSMEGNVFAFIGSRMKGRRACWSVEEGKRFATLLCNHHSVSVTTEVNVINPCESCNATLSAAKAPKKDGKGYESIRNIAIPSGMKWLKNISSCMPLTDFPF